jgi:hypothetical protein
LRLRISTPVQFAVIAEVGPARRTADGLTDASRASIGSTDALK